jgi:integrase
MTPRTVAAYRDERLGVASETTVRLELAVVSHLWTVATREWGMALPANPVQQIRRPVGAARTRRLQGDEEQRLLAACDDARNPMLGWIVRVALETAMRHGEIVGLTINMVDLSRRVVVLPRTKNGDQRTVPLTVEATRILTEAIQMEGRTPGTDLVFPGEPGRDRAVRPYTVNKGWQRAMERAGISDLHFHDLRHEATSRLVERGLSDQQVAAITGHRSMQMLRRYTHLRGEDLVAVLDHMEG